MDGGEDTALLVCKTSINRSDCDDLINSQLHSIVVISPPVGMRSIAINVLYVCLFICPLSYLKNRTSRFHHFFCVLSVTVARSVCHDNAI